MASKAQMSYVYRMEHNTLVSSQFSVINISSTMLNVNTGNTNHEVKSIDTCPRPYVDILTHDSYCHTTHFCGVDVPKQVNAWVGGTNEIWDSTQCYINWLHQRHQHTLVCHFLREKNSAEWKQIWQTHRLHHNICKCSITSDAET